MRQKVFVSSLIVTLVFLLLGYTLFSIILIVASMQQENYPQIPPYPHAQAIRLVRSADAERVISFDTTDSEADILAFYDRELPKLGWIWIANPEYYGYAIEANKRPKHLFTFEIDTIGNKGHTQVKLRLVYAGPGTVFPPDYTFPPGFN